MTPRSQCMSVCGLVSPTHVHALRRNMDIVGVPGVAAEAELLAAIVLLLERLGLGPADVCIKVSSRRVLQAVLGRFGVADAQLGPVSVVVDKMEKIPLEKVSHHLLRTCMLRAPFKASQPDCVAPCEGAAVVLVPAAAQRVAPLYFCEDGYEHASCPACPQAVEEQRPDELHRRPRSRALHAWLLQGLRQGTFLGQGSRA